MRLSRGIQVLEALFGGEHESTCVYASVHAFIKKKIPKPQGAQTLFGMLKNYKGL